MFLGIRILVPPCVVISWSIPAGNKIAGPGAKALADALKVNASLQTLKLTGTWRGVMNGWFGVKVPTTSGGTRSDTQVCE